MENTRVVDRLECPMCKGTKFQLGPRGGASRNIRCVCGHELNVARVPGGEGFLVEDITKIRSEPQL